MEGLKEVGAPFCHSSEFISRGERQTQGQGRGQSPHAHDDSRLTYTLPSRAQPRGAEGPGTARPTSFAVQVHECRNRYFIYSLQGELYDSI